MPIIHGKNKLAILKVKENHFYFPLLKRQNILIYNNNMNYMVTVIIWLYLEKVMTYKLLMIAIYIQKAFLNLVKVINCQME